MQPSSSLLYNPIIPSYLSQHDKHTVFYSHYNKQDFKYNPNKLDLEQIKIQTGVTRWSQYIKCFANTFLLFFLVPTHWTSKNCLKTHNCPITVPLPFTSIFSMLPLASKMLRSVNSQFCWELRQSFYMPICTKT